ncbi:MAG TPA: pyridoxal phosphate-dependent aminotransferase [Polyangiaceae bacterium]|nr:pyridoxal phosphate-dependent aminotransferase [Polyangiaceae bacterium]
MFGPTRYLQWARRFAGKVQFDLATSGIPTVPLAELGVPPADCLDDWSGLPRLRDAIAAHNAVPPGEALASLGTTQALWLACVALTSPGDEVLVEQPAYEPLVRIAEGVGARVLRFARDAREGFALDPERIAGAMTSRTRVIVVTNLHNPSGARASPKELTAVARVAEAHGAHLLVDEVYAPFDTLVDGRGVFQGSARRLARNVVAVSSLTKCYGLGPSRIGWLLGPAEVVTRADDAMTACCGMLPLAHSHVALHAFDRIGFLADRARSSLEGKRSRVAAWVEENASLGIAWSAPTEGLFALVTVAGDADLTPTIEAAARDRGVLVTPGAFFGVPNAFRVAWSAPAGVLEEGLARLGDVLRARV